jgi:mono/diheme cytochrome c family protein
MEKGTMNGGAARGGWARISIATSIFGVLIFSACQSSPNREVAAGSDELAKARAIFQRECATCHGAKGEGTAMTQFVANVNLKSAQARALSDEQLRQQIINGKGAMPPFAGRLTPDQIDALVRYIRREIQGQSNR